MTSKREDYLEWPDYFMAITFLSAQRSKDPSSQVFLNELVLSVFLGTSDNYIFNK